jgi:hypothetical protein
MSATDYPCTTADLTPYLPPGQTITSTTDPSLTDVGAMVVNVADEINGVLRSRGYTLPWSAADTTGLSLLNTTNIYGTLARWARTKFPAEAGPGGSKGLAEDYEKKYQKLLADIEAGALGMADEMRQGTIGQGFECGDHEPRPFVRRGSVF